MSRPFYWTFVIVLAIALLLQILFSMLYWKWIPGWVKNPYGRLAQLGSWVHIILLSLYLCFTFFGKFFNRYVAEVMLISAFLPLVFFGILQLLLLKQAVDLSRFDHPEEVASDLAEKESRAERKEAVRNDN